MRRRGSQKGRERDEGRRRERQRQRQRQRDRESKEERVKERQGKRDAVALVNLSNLSSYSLDQAESDWYRRIDLVNFSPHYCDPIANTSLSVQDCSNRTRCLQHSQFLNRIELLSFLLAAKLGQSEGARKER